MASQEDIEAWKQDFLTRLDAFMKNRANEIGDPAGWKVSALTLKRYGPSLKTPKLEMKNSVSKEGIAFSVSVAPDHCTPGERLALREYAYRACAERGFAIPNARIAPLAPEVMEGVRKGNHDAWNIFVGKHLPGFTRNADYLLRSGGDSPTLLEPEDLVSAALMEVFRKCRNGNWNPDLHPQSIIYRNMARLVSPRTCHSRHPRRQSGDGSEDFGNIVQPEYDGLREVLESQLRSVLEKTKKRLRDRIDPEKGNIVLSHQNALLSQIIYNWAVGNESLTLKELGKKLDLSQERARQLMNGLTQEIKETARLLADDNPEYEAISVVIDHLVRRAAKHHRSQKSR